MRAVSDGRRRWALLAAAVLLAAAGWGLWRWGQARIYGVDGTTRPPVETAAVDDAAERLKNVIEIAQNERNKLPEVIEGAKNVIRRDVAGLGDNDIAYRWNGLLGRYREDRTAAEGISADR